MERVSNAGWHLGLQPKSEQSIDEKFGMDGVGSSIWNHEMSDDDQTSEPEDSSDAATLSHFPVMPRPPVYELDFIDWYPPGDLTLLYKTADGTVKSIDKINRELIQCNFPLVAISWGLLAAGTHLYVPTLDHFTAIPFLRYLYTRSYALRYDDQDLFAEVPTSLLLHSQMYRLGEHYDDGELRSQSYINILRQCEFGCSSPEQPIDLCQAVSYAYNAIEDGENVKDAIVNYCVARFLDHRLANDDDFRRLTLEQPLFHQDLCRNVRSRGYEDADVAMAIIQLHPPRTTTIVVSDHDDISRPPIDGDVQEEASSRHSKPLLVFRPAPKSQSNLDPMASKAQQDKVLQYHDNIYNQHAQLQIRTKPTQRRTRPTSAQSIRSTTPLLDHSDGDWTHVSQPASDSESDWSII